MDLAQILGQLWRRRALVAFAAVIAIVVGVSLAYRVSVSPLGFEKKSLELGTASTTLLIDSGHGAVLDAAGDIVPLSSRAQTFAAIGSSDPVLSRLARDNRIPRSFIVSDPGFVQPKQQNATDRSAAIPKDNNVYRVSFIAPENQPLLHIATQAPTAAAAVKLANGAARALQAYVVGEQDKQKVSSAGRATLRQLGSAKGGVINPGANITAALLSGLAIFVAACLLILFGDRLRADVRRKRSLGYGGQRVASPLTEQRADDFTDERGVRVLGDDRESDVLGDRRRSHTRA